MRMPSVSLFLRQAQSCSFLNHLHQKFSGRPEGLFRGLRGNLLSFPTPGPAVTRRFYGKADEDHHRNRFAVDPAGPELRTRMVFPLRGGGGNDRARRHGSDLEPGTARIGGVAEFGGVASVAGGRWLRAYVPEFTARSRAEDN